LLHDGQTDNSKLNFDGTGIGLSICISFAQSLNGLIEFESIPKQGTKFAFVVPVLPVDGDLDQDSVESKNKEEKDIKISRNIHYCEEYDFTVDDCISDNLHKCNLVVIAEDSKPIRNL